MLTRFAFATMLLAALLLPNAPAARAAVAQDKMTAWILTRNGQNLEGEMANGILNVEMDGRTRGVALRDILTLQIGAAASEIESERIINNLAAVSADKDRPGREVAAAELTDIGLPVIGPLLAAYKDTDIHEPKPLYRLFARLIPGYADRLDRSLDLVRLANGETLRGHVTSGDLKLSGPDRRATAVPLSGLRRLAVRRRVIDKTFDVDALRHCTPIEFLDTCVAVSSASRMEQTARGFVRLSFDIDGWASDPDGIKVPGPNYKTNLVDGFPFGALVGRVGPAGPRWLAGSHIQKSGMTRGRLYVAVNDNGHWQNNIGSFRVHLHATDAYDLGDPQ